MQAVLEAEGRHVIGRSTWVLSTYLQLAAKLYYIDKNDQTGIVECTSRIHLSFTQLFFLLLLLQPRDFFVCVVLLPCPAVPRQMGGG